MYKRIVVKIGSGVISKEGQLDRKILKQVVDQIAELRKMGIEVILITSGAVATGRGLISIKKGADQIVQKQVFAAVGQVKLMSYYSELFDERGFVCAQVLVTKEDFRDRLHYLNMKNCVTNLLRDNVIPVINENDVIAITELIFTDNDELAGLISSQMDADATIIMTSVDGVIAGDLEDPKAKVIPEIDFKKDSFEKYISTNKTSVGRGGMVTKFGIARKLAAQGIETHIVNGKKQGVLVDVINGEKIGTKFIANRKLSALKRRIAFSEGLSKGVVYINQFAKEALLARRGVSLLPVGVVKIEGTFKKGDVIEIRDATNRKFGFGLAQYDSAKAQSVKGKKNMPELVHYDYLFIENK